MAALLISLVSGLLQIFLPALFKAADPTAEDGAKPGELEDALHDQLKKEGWE